MLMRPNIDAMSAYIPGEQPADVTRVVKLNQNENPYPPSPKALAVLREFDGGSLRFYPDPMATEFCRVAGEAVGVPADWICVGDGSDDLITMIARAAAGKGRPIVAPEPTFPYYLTQAQVEDAEYVAIPCNEDFTLPIEALARANGAVTFLASPNSPTGAGATAEQISWLAGKLRGLLVVDEAYVDFARQNAAGLVQRHENLVVMRTLSKGYSLAALRLGFAIASPVVKQALLKTKAIYNVGALPAAVGAAAMADQDYHNDCVRKILAERARLEDELPRRGFRVWPSEANFLMVTVPADGAAFEAALKARNVLVRYFSKPPMTDKLRISVGTPQEDTILLAAIDAVCGLAPSVQPAATNRGKERPQKGQSPKGS
jgi:histidinol-phosphate aminotransferase